MKKSLKIFLIVLGLVLAAVLIAGIILFMYYPSYKLNERERKVDTSQMGTGEIKVMSCNVRCFTPSDYFKKSWFYRADLIMKNIENAKPSIIGFQEVTTTQYKYLKKSLNEYDSVITYRDNSFIKEGTPIFYKKDMYELNEKGSFWLSETPEKMSKDWGAACYRICSYAILKDKATQKEFVVFNTHLDHVSDEARIKGIGVVLDKIKEFGSLPTMLMGDLNADENSETYKSATQNFNDVKYLTKNPQVSCTYQNWGKNLDLNCIDYIMISKTGFDVNSYEVIRKTYSGVYPSDHFPIMATLTLK